MQDIDRNFVSRMLKPDQKVGFIASGAKYITKKHCNYSATDGR